MRWSDAQGKIICFEYHLISLYPAEETQHCLSIWLMEQGRPGGRFWFRPTRSSETNHQFMNCSKSNKAPRASDINGMFICAGYICDKMAFGNNSKKDGKRIFLGHSSVMMWRYHRLTDILVSHLFCTTSRVKISLMKVKPSHHAALNTWRSVSYDWVYYIFMQQ